MYLWLFEDQWWRKLDGNLLTWDNKPNNDFDIPQNTSESRTLKTCQSFQKLATFQNSEEKEGRCKLRNRVQHCVFYQNGFLPLTGDCGPAGWSHETAAALPLGPRPVSWARLLPTGEYWVAEACYTGTVNTHSTSLLHLLFPPGQAATLPCSLWASWDPPAP